MLNILIKFSLTKRLLTLGISAVLIFLGLSSFYSLPVDVFPDLSKPTVTIVTEAHGKAPEEVETLITIPIESQLNGLPRLSSIRSTSGVGLSIIYVQFEWGTDIYLSRQLINEKLILAKDQLPEDIQPAMGPISSLMGQIQQIAIYPESNQIDPMYIRTIAEWVVRPRLLTIPGVAQVIAMGGGLKQYQILISSEKLNTRSINLEDLNERLSQISQNTTGGYLTRGENELLIRNIGTVSTIEDIENTVIGHHFGKPVLLKEIAEVKIDSAIKRGDSSYNGKPSVVLVIQKQPGTDTVKITKDIEAAIESIKSSLPQGIGITTDVFKQSNFIEASIDGVKNKLIFGTILVFIVLFAFLANLRMSLITLTAIPLSFLMTFIVFKLFGLTVNTMTLGGLAIAIGELVDDSIVDVENIFRRLRENRFLKKPKSILKVIFDASSEVRNSIVIATLIICFVFVPLLNLSGIEGRLFTPLAISYLTALLASLLVSLTVTPVLCYYLLGKAMLTQHADTALVATLKKWDRKILNKALDRPKVLISLVVVLFVMSMMLVPMMGKNFLPEFNEGTALITVGAKPGISLDKANSIGLQAEQLIMEIPEVKSVSRRTGRAEKDEHAMGLHVSEIDVDFKKDSQRNRDQILNEIRNKLSVLEGMNISVGQPIAHLIDHMVSGVAAQIAIKIYGQDLSELRKSANQVRDAIKDISGVVDLKVEDQGLIPQLKIYVLREEASQYGLSSGDITSILEKALNGERVAQVIDGQKFFDIIYRFDDMSRSNIEMIKNIVLKIMPNGQRVRVSDVADVYETQGPNEVNRDNGMRRVVVSTNVSGRDLVSTVNEIKQKISQSVNFSIGTYPVYGGQFQSHESATQKIFSLGLLSIIAIALLLYSHFKSKMIVAQIMLTIPFAFIGGLVMLFVINRSLTIASMIGFVTLCGIACRNGIMMISHYLHLMKYENEAFSKEMIIRGSLERLVPVIMTAIVASTALLPLVFSKGQTGSEILQPVAVVIVGGLISSTILDILITPIIFYRYGKNSALKYINNKKTTEEL
ncbi:MAG: efflux RND transporter permease subunit [Pseudobdellovibrio sp.]